ncbi:hypothetical protein [Streptomyces sp. NPDC005732]|uniref:hypothetical protein n=1 Tax=Streptomyces sp. NPDC005732 TaxID=3157057 RepID=UPI0033DFC868
MPYLVPAEGKAREGKQAVAQSDMAALTAAAAAGSNPTKAEFDKVVTDLATIRTAHNALLAKLRTAGLLAP